MRNESNKAIEVRELTKKFGDVTAVDHISFGVRKREIFGFLGPNGAGKTTTIRMLTGLITPDSGNVQIDGVDIRKNPIKAKMNIGVIPEMGNIYVDLTAKQNIILAGKFYGIARGELNNRADALLAKFGLLERANDPVKTFSKGMKQQVNIASAIVHSPELLFLDEPTSGLDVQSQRMIKTIIREMNQRGTTIFLTTHNIEEANVLCDRVGILNGGKIAAIDTPKGLKRTFEETQSVEISFDTPVDLSELEESRLVIRKEKLGDKWRLYTDNPDKLVKYLARFAQDNNLIFSTMEICGASLEDAFVTLTEDKY